MICIFFINLLVACDNDNALKKAEKDNSSTNIKQIIAINNEVTSCLNNIGQDVKVKKYSANTFSGNKCGVTRYGKDGIALNIYNSFYQNNLADLNYILKSLNDIAVRYGYSSYSILISDNETKLMVDREIQKHQL
jgi:hypothetical protein